MPPGWWLGEEPEWQTSPNAPLEIWDRALRETGFTGVDFEVGDYEEPGSCLHQGQRRRARPVLHPRRLRDHRILYSQALSSQCYARPPGGLASKWSPQTVLRVSAYSSWSEPSVPHFSARPGSILLQTKPPASSELFDHRPTPLRENEINASC